MRLKGLTDIPAPEKLPVTGKDLIALGMKPGPEFKRVLGKVQDAVDDNPNLTKQQALELVKGNIG